MPHKDKSVRAAYQLDYARANYERKRESEIARATRRNNEKRKAYDPAKDPARQAVQRALRNGDLVRPDTCPACGGSDRRIEAHHTDYSKPLDVQWLCSRCHGLERRKPRDGTEVSQYLESKKVAA